MNGKIYEYDAIIEASEAGKGGAYVRFPYDLRAEFGAGRAKVRATFDGEPYEGSIVNMGVKNPDGSACHIIGIRKDIRAKIAKQIGDSVRVTISEADKGDAPLRVRTARTSDAAAIRRINLIALGYDCPQAETRAQLTLLLGNAHNRLWVAEGAQGVLGYIHAADYDTVYGGCQKNILALAVDPAAQGRGIGRALLLAAEDWARQSGAIGVRLVSGFDRTGAHRFYEACGYRMRKEQKNYVKQW